MRFHVIKHICVSEVSPTRATVCMYVCVRVHACVCMRICAYVCVCVCLCVWENACLQERQIHKNNLQWERQTPSFLLSVFHLVNVSRPLTVISKIIIQNNMSVCANASPRRPAPPTAASCCPRVCQLMMDGGQRWTLAIRECKYTEASAWEMEKHAYLILWDYARPITTEGVVVGMGKGQGVSLGIKGWPFKMAVLCSAAVWVGMWESSAWEIGPGDQENLSTTNAVKTNVMKWINSSGTRILLKAALIAGSKRRANAFWDLMGTSALGYIACGI